MASFLEGKIGWGGRTRTFTVRINSAVSYRLDHAPVVGQNTIRCKSSMSAGGCRFCSSRIRSAVRVSAQQSPEVDSKQRDTLTRLKLEAKRNLQAPG